jgi:hypothetical protein
MKKIMLLALALTCAQSLEAIAAEHVQCAIYSGTFTKKKIVKVWDSRDSQDAPFKFYSTFDLESLGITGLWGVNIGPTVTEESKDRFSVLVYAKHGEQLAAMDTDVKGPIDVSLYIPSHDVSISCLGTE